MPGRGLLCRSGGRDIELDPRRKSSIGPDAACDVILEGSSTGGTWATIRMLGGWCVQPLDGTEVALGDTALWSVRPTWIKDSGPLLVWLRRNGHEAYFEARASSREDPSPLGGILPAGSITIPPPAPPRWPPTAPPLAPQSPAYWGSVPQRLPPSPRPTSPDPITVDVPVSPGGWIVIGRDGGTADLPLPGLDVALRHAKVRRSSDGSLDVRDLSRGLGVFVDGRPVLATRIPPGGSFIVGHHVLRADIRGVTVRPVRKSPILECHDLKVTYRDKPASSLSGISFVLNSEEFMAVIGPSSAGKSTLSRALLGEVENVSGSVGFAGEALPGSGLPDSLVSFLPQDDYLPNDLTVRQTVRFAAKLRLADVSRAQLSQRVYDVMARLDLTEHARTDIADLSGGTRKRVSLALELLSDPILLILDEPTSGLDEGLDRRLMRLLASWREKTAILLVTHSMVNLDESDQVLAINAQGSMGYLGPPQEMLEAFDAQTYADVMDKLRDGETARVARPAVGTTTVRRGSRPVPAPARRSQVWALAMRESRRFAPSGRASHAGRRRTISKLAQHLLLAPVIVALLASFVDPQGLAKSVGSPNSQLTTVLSVLSITTAFFAAAVTSGSIVSDYAMIKREARWGIRARSVITSRFLVFGTIALLQGALAGVVFLGLRSGPSDDGPVPGPLVVIVSLSLLCLASAAAGLFVSAGARTVQQGIFALMMLSVIQVVLSGLLTPLGDPKNAGVWLLAGLSWLTPIRWAVAALGSGIGLNSVRGMTPDGLWSHNLIHLAGAWAALLMLTAFFLSAALVVLSTRLKRRL
jgi:ABC transport system ATP-binding/permease protein